MEFNELPLAKLALHKVTRHPAEPQTKSQRILLGHEVGQEKHPLPAKHVSVIATLAGVLDRQLDVLLQVRKRQPSTARQRMSWRDAKNGLDLRQRIDLQVITWLVVLDQHEIGLVPLEAVLHAVQELDLDLNACRNTLIGHGLQGSERRLRRQDAIDNDEQARFPPCCQLSRQAPETLCLGQQSPPFCQHDFTCRRQTHAIPAAIEQREAQLLLELLDPVAQCGLGAVQFGSSPGESPGATAFTRTFSAASSAARELVSIFKPALPMQ